MLQERFLEYMRGQRLVAAGEKVLLAVSGGVDSMVMLSLFAANRYDIGVAHCNFGLRGRESDEDEALVGREAERCAAPLYNMRFDTAAEMERTGESLQMAARRLRYAWFNELCGRHGYTAIAIAHHADDSIETFFINLFRGTGLRGLTGIHQVRGRVVRPLMFASRREILDYAAAAGIPYREDSSNRSTKYLRNKIRLGLMPRIREISPNFTEMMTENIGRLTEAQQFVERSVATIRERIEERCGDEVAIDPAAIPDGLPAGFVLFEILGHHGFRGGVVAALNRALASGEPATGKRFYGRERVAYIDRGRIIITPIGEGDSCEAVVERDTDRIYCANAALYFEHIDIGAVESFDVPENIALLDAGRLLFPLTARRWREGDSFIPLGMAGHKKVSDLLIDGRVSQVEKSRQFVLLSGGDIVWVVGRRIDDRYRLGADTESVLRITKEIF